MQVEVDGVVLLALERRAYDQAPAGGARGRKRTSATTGGNVGISVQMNQKHLHQTVWDMSKNFSLYRFSSLSCCRTFAPVS